MTRRTDWHQRLCTFLAETADRPFAPGRHDCALFAAGAVKAVTGRDPARGWRGYRTVARGQVRLRQAGFEDHVALARSLFPQTAQPMPGDLAVIETPDGPALGVVQGTMIYAPAAKGWALVPRGLALLYLEVR